MEALAILKILLILFLLGSTLYSVIVYQGRKKSSLKSLATFRQEGTPQRNLDPTELRLVDAVIAEAEKKTLGTLTGNAVFALSGPYLRHGLTTNGNTVWHDTIGGVEVLLPYDAEYFLREHNDALVVLAEKKAIVVALNDDFTLAGGEERNQRREQKQQQWESGDHGELARVVEEDEQTREDDPAGTLRIREQRDETDAEIASRRGRGLAMLPAFLWILAFVCLGIAIGVDSSLIGSISLATGLLFVVIALFRFFRKPSPDKPQKVNQVSGQICLTPVAVDEQNNVQISVTLNESIGFVLPEHWRPFIEYEDGQNQEMAVRVDDYSVVSYGNRMSLDEEVRRFPPVYWGRHLTLALVGAIALLFPLASFTELSRDLLFTGQLLSGAQETTPQTPDAVLQQPPAIGAPVSIEGRGQCALNTDGYRPTFDCRRIHWGSNVPQSQHLEEPEIIRQLRDRTLLQTRTDGYLSLMATMQGWDTYRNGKPVMLRHLPELIDTLDSACSQSGTSSSAESQCERIHRHMLSRLIFTLDHQPETWTSLRNAVQTQAGSDDPVTAITSEAHVKALRQRLNQLANELDMERGVNIARDITNSQQGGVQIRLVQGPVPSTLMPDDTTSPYQASIDAMTAMIDNAAGQPFKLRGMVTDYQVVDGGTAVLSLDLTRHRDNPGNAVLNVLWLLLAAGLLAGHGLMTVIRFKQSRQRSRAVAALYA